MSDYEGFVLAIIVTVIPLFVGLLVLLAGKAESKDKRETFWRSLVLLLVSSVVGVFFHLRWVDVPRTRDTVERALVTNSCEGLRNVNLPDELDEALNLVKERCDENRRKRDRAALIVGREDIMPVWCGLVSSADEVWATNVASAVDWEEFRGSRDPCALSCQKRPSKIQRVFIYDEDSEDHKRFSTECAGIQAGAANITTRLLTLDVAHDGPPRALRQSRKAIDGLDVVILRFGSSEVGILTDVDGENSYRVALRSYIYTDPETVARLKTFFNEAWEVASPVHAKPSNDEQEKK